MLTDWQRATRNKILQIHRDLVKMLPVQLKKVTCSAEMAQVAALALGTATELERKSKALREYAQDLGYSNSPKDTK